MTWIIEVIVTPGVVVVVVVPFRSHRYWRCKRLRMGRPCHSCRSYCCRTHNRSSSRRDQEYSQQRRIYWLNCLHLHRCQHCRRFRRRRPFRSCHSYWRPRHNCSSSRLAQEYTRQDRSYWLNCPHLHRHQHCRRFRRRRPCHHYHSYWYQMHNRSSSRQDKSIACCTGFTGRTALAYTGTRTTDFSGSADCSISCHSYWYRMHNCNNFRQNQECTPRHRYLPVPDEPEVDPTVGVGFVPVF